MRRAPVVAGLLALAACYAPSPGSGAPCTSDDVCPGEQRCVANVCEPAGVLGDAVVADAGPTIDAPGPIGPWQPPVRVGSCKGCDDPTLTADELELYVNQDDARIYASVRTAPDADWPTPVLVDALAESGTTEQSPNLVAHGLALYFSRRIAAGTHDLYVTRRASRAAAWSIPVRIEELSTVDDELDPWVAPDELFMFFERTGNSTGFDLWYAMRSSTAEPWGAPMRATAWNSASDDTGAVVSDDTLEAFFASNRTGASVLYQSRRPDADGTFSPAAAIDELVSTGGTDPWISADGRRLYFTITEADDRVIVRSQR